jgi:hypothetical protein
MKQATWEKLQALDEKCGGGTHSGKLKQKLLALAFLRAGAKKLTDRCIQGIDLTFEWGDRKLAMEVKTTEGSEVTLGTKDIEGLENQGELGTEPYFAFLGGGRDSDWFFAPYTRGDFTPNSSVLLDEYKILADSTLRDFLGTSFDEIMEEHGYLALTDGYNYLEELLQQSEEYLRA